MNIVRIGVLSTISGVPDRAYNNASVAYMRDPRRPIRLLDFMTLHEREILIFTSLGVEDYEVWLDKVVGDLNV